MNNHSKERHWIELDGVRGLAALLVIYAHVFLMWIPAAPRALFWARTVSGLAWTGVYLFFLLSGFLIGGILLRYREAPNYFSAFYVRRAYRILPLYACLLGCFLIARQFFGAAHPSEFGGTSIPLWSYFALLQNFPMAQTGDLGALPLSVTWSVALEEQFYLFLPLWIRWIPPRWHAASFLALAAFGLVFRATVKLAYPPFLVFGSAEALFLGTFLAWLFRSRPALFRSSAARALSVGLLLVSGAGMSWMALRHNGHFATVTVITLFWGAFLWLTLSLLGTRWTAWLRTGLLCGVGRISYGVYLFHPLLMTLVFLIGSGGLPNHALGLRGAALSGVTFALTLGVAAMFYFGMERHLIALGRRHGYRSAAKAPAAVETVSPEPAPAVFKV